MPFRSLADRASQRNDEWRRRESTSFGNLPSRLAGAAPFSVAPLKDQSSRPQAKQSKPTASLAGKDRLWDGFERPVRVEYRPLGRERGCQMRSCQPVQRIASSGARWSPRARRRRQLDEGVSAPLGPQQPIFDPSQRDLKKSDYLAIELLVKRAPVEVERT